MADDLRTMSLHEITEAAGEQGLRDRFEIEVRELPSSGRPRIRAALTWAAALHRDDRRSREPYLNHLLRVSIRIMHHYRVSDPDVICAAVLHDAVEDHAADIAGVDDAAAALAVVAARFGPRVASLVGAVTNPTYDLDRDVHEQYREHVLSSLAADPWARVIKLSDFTDNAVGIQWAAPAKAKQVAPKYYPLVDDLRELLMRPDTPLTEAVKQDIERHLTSGAQRLGDLIDD
jgi:(p)ppGpp synthase/HD superfamily hydrolase